MQNGLAKALQSVDFQCCDYITEEILFKFLEAHGNQLVGLNLSGIPFLAETFWTQCIPFIRKTRWSYISLRFNVCSLQKLC